MTQEPGLEPVLIWHAGPHREEQKPLRQDTGLLKVKSSFASHLRALVLPLAALLQTQIPIHVTGKAT